MSQLPKSAAVDTSYLSATKIRFMVGSFPSGVCESNQCKREELAAPSMQNTMCCRTLRHPRLIKFAAQPAKDIHHSGLAGFVESAQGDVLSAEKQVFGFSHFSSLMDVSK